MKTLTTTLTLAALIAATPVFAEDAHHPEQAQGQATEPATTKNKAEATLQKLQDNAGIMQQQLERIAQTETDAERQQMIAEHMQTMQESMEMARSMQPGMMGCPMMEGGMMSGGMGMNKGSPPSGGSPEGMRQMEKRLDLMQMMMEQMMHRLDDRQGSMPAK